METIDQIRLAKQAKKSINTATSDEKNKGLRAMADALVDATADILAANQLDMEAARGRISEVMLDQAADLDKALSIIQNAKTSRPSVCNAMEVLLVHEAIAGDFLPLVKKVLVDEAPVPVEMRLDAQAQQIISGTPASETDFDTEFLDYVMALKVVPSVEEAIAHIEAHSTHHSDAIVSEDATAIEVFSSQVDSAAVYVNASTRFTDGGEFGLGCEMGISTQKLHARGPMGLRELTSYRYLVTGNGQVR